MSHSRVGGPLMVGGMSTEDWKRLDKRFDTVHDRFDAVEQRLDALTDAIVYLAEQYPGTMPGTESHIVREVKKADSRRTRHHAGRGEGAMTAW